MMCLNGEYVVDPFSLYFKKNTVFLPSRHMLAS